MKQIFAFATFLLLVFSLNAQKNEVSPKEVFKRGYTRLGLSMLGNSLNPSISPEANIETGSYGAGIGYSFEFGHIFYFRKRNEGFKFNVGLDWTIASLTLNKLNKWQAYGPGYTEGGFIENATASASSKLGPVLAFNPVSKLVIEARVQMCYMARVTNFMYDDYDQTTGEQKAYLEFVNDKVKAATAFNAGITIRYGFIGVSLDYLPTNFITNYSTIRPGQDDLDVSKRIPLKNMQLKLNFSF